ncbi:unnamed protein product [Meganyctiphanes norvegica]|uniref:Histone acetyltransferase type B catalytic subunit n=1 Tax=Meganyctiphanes norvegica TaxID=48144 RepID=A0AAV2Q6N1_MEGNR
MPAVTVPAGGSGIAKGDLDKYICDSNEAVEFKLVRNPEDLENDGCTFKPEMTHQVYGDEERIFGYTGLNIKLYYSACRLTPYIGLAYKDKINPAKCDGVEADQVLKPLSEYYPPGYFTNIDDFSAALIKDASFRPFGELQNQHKVYLGGSERTFEVYSHDISPPGFREFHERMQTFILFFIDAASYIDTDDEKWRFFVMYEKYNVNGSPRYAAVGFTTVYEYYAYPNNIRPRISQMLVLPPFQQGGLGTQMLQTIYNYYIAHKSVMDITVEDPSENFTRLRDYLDCKSCMKLPSYQAEKLMVGFTEEMAKEAQSKLRINKKQARRVYEILRLHVTKRSDKESYRNYRLHVKNRLNVQFKKEDNDMAKLKKILKPEEFTATMTMTSKDQRLESLEHQYQELEDHYSHILERLAGSDLS